MYVLIGWYSKSGILQKKLLIPKGHLWVTKTMGKSKFHLNHIFRKTICTRFLFKTYFIFSRPWILIFIMHQNYSEHLSANWNTLVGRQNNQRSSFPCSLPKSGNAGIIYENKVHGEEGIHKNNQWSTPYLQWGISSTSTRTPLILDSVFFYSQHSI